MGPVDQEPRRRSPDAAVAYRQDRRHPAFQNDRSLSDAQIDTIVRWVDAGAPKGDPKDMPPPVKWPDDNVWNFAGLRRTARFDHQVAPWTCRRSRRTRGTSRSSRRA